MIRPIRRFINKARMPDRTPDWWVPESYNPERRCSGLHELEHILTHENSVMAWFEEMKIYDNDTGKLETIYSATDPSNAKWLFEGEWCQLLGSNSIIEIRLGHTSPFLGQLCVAYKKWCEKKVEDILLK